jgi:hypothetical protein
VWVITLYLNENLKMYEFNTEEEAKEAFRNIKGDKILSEIVYYNDPCFVKSLLLPINHFEL